ncbi:DUF6308 family protein [Corynebacterium halotolerans]|uniref:DUF6308 family protein n=1 Tax=Corynebacterium halotolerans TaxID=225326 RepID=UPI003CE69C65
MPHNPEQISGLLTAIPIDVPLSADEAGEHVKTANQLWYALRRKGFGPTAVFKLLARKCPRLLPVYDTYLANQLGTTSVRFYENLRTVLRHENHALENHLSTIRREVPGTGHLSTLRVFDIIVWRAEDQRRRAA